MTHFPTCTPNYPEKLEGEAPQAVTEFRLPDGTLVRSCNDCGAHEIVEESKCESV